MAELLPESGEEINPRKGEDNYQLLFNNAKMTYDKFLDIITRESVRSSDHSAQLNNIAVQHLQNAVENANLISKNSIVNLDLCDKHAMNNFALSVNKLWNLEIPEAASQAEVLKAVGMDQATIAAIQAAVVSAVQDAVAK